MQVMSQSLASQQGGLSPHIECTLCYVMPLLFIDRDKDECCKKDVPTVAMTLSKPPFALC